MRRIKFSRRAMVPTSLAAVAVVIVGAAWASDHQQSRITELTPRMDITDIYAFPGGGGTDGSRVTLVMNTSSPILPGADATFDPNLLYQFKIDNTGDGLEDLVIQVTFDSTANNTRLINVRGPAAPPSTMDPAGSPQARGGTATILLKGQPAINRGAINTTVTSTTTTGGGQMQAFAGLRDDSFFVDLEQFFRIIPDRKPVTGPLAALPETPTATAFRGTAPPFDVTRGAPRDLLTAVRANTLAIVLEMPVALLAPGSNKRIGLWGTISR